MNKKPICKLIGENGNIFNLLCISKRTLEENYLVKESNEMVERVLDSKSYSEALQIISEYVDVI